MGYSTVFLLACVSWLAEGHLADNMVHDTGLPTCHAVLHQATHPPISAPMPPDIRGKWVSTSCETRPGPQYVLRSYSFHRDGSFHLALHFYRDPHCTHPAHSLAAHGHLALGRPSWVTPGGTEADYTLTRVEVVAHTHRDAALVAAAVNASCPGKVTKPWKPHKSHTILAYTETGNHVTEDEDCGRGLGGAWHELQLLRVEETSPLKLPKEGTPKARRELFLGDLHTDVSRQDLYRPTGYQRPLVNEKYASDCAVCSLIGRSNERNPAHLHARPELPLLLAGSWASRRCETRPYGMFLTRHIVFSSSEDDWKMALSYFHDPECTRPSFTVDARGTYTRAAPGPYAHDFHVTNVVLTPEDPDLASALNSYKGKECGRPGSWEVGKSQDVTPTGGCQAVGVRVPVVEKEILRSGVDEDGAMWLALGQTATTPLQVGGLPRPTSWGPQLVRCRHYAPQDIDNSLQPIVGARTAYSDAHKHTQSLFTVVFLCLFVAVWAP